MKSESALTKKIKDYLKSKGAYVEKIFGGGFQAGGIPDILACYRSRFIGIEVKTPTGHGKASDLQKLKVREIRKAGGIAFITDSLEDVKKIIYSIDNNTKIEYNDKYLIDNKQ